MIMNCRAEDGSMPKRKPYLTDVSDEERAFFVVPYLAWSARTPRKAPTTYARSSTSCAGSCGLEYLDA